MSTALPRSDEIISTRQRVAQASGDYLIRLGRFGDAARVVVRMDHCGAVALERLLHDFARVNARAVNGAPEPVCADLVRSAGYEAGPKA